MFYGGGFMVIGFVVVVFGFFVFFWVVGWDFMRCVYEGCEIFSLGGVRWRVVL